jgi:hypothetical protein
MVPLPADTSGEGNGDSLSLNFGRLDTHVLNVGEIDLLAPPDVARLFESLDLIAVRIHMDLEAPTFMDFSGLQPLIDVARRQGNPLSNVDAWDHLSLTFLELGRGFWRTAAHGSSNHRTGPPSRGRTTRVLSAEGD